MKKLSISLLFLLCAVCAHAQLGNVVMVFSHGAPSGACPNSFTQDTDLTNNNVYGCSSAGSWFQIGGVTGSGTVSSVGTSSPLGGGPITTSGTITLGTVPVTDGGSGATTLTGVIKGNGTSPFTAAASSDIISLFSTCSGTQYLGADGACHSAGVGTLTGVTTGASSGLQGGGTSGTLNVGLLQTCSTNQVLQWNGSAWACASSSGLPSGTGIPLGISGVYTTGCFNTPTIDVRCYFTPAYPTYAQAQSQDLGAVLNAALVAATPTGACVDVSQLNLLNAPNIAVYPVTSNIFAGLTSNTYVPCIIGGNFQLVTSVTQSTPGGALKISGGAPGGIGGTGMVIQPCNTTGNCTVGGTTVNKFPTSASCATSGGLDCYATGVPSSGALSTYSTGTVTYTTGSKTVTGSGTTWTSAMVGGTFVSSCGAASLAACTVGSTSLYTTGRIVAVGSSTSLTLDATYAGNVASGTAGQSYVIFLPNTSVVWCAACLGNNLQKSFTGQRIDDLAIDLNGISGVAYLAKGAQEGSVLDNFACFLSFGTPTGLTAGGTCLAWDQSVRESGATGGTTANQTFLGHFSVHDGRMGVGATGAGGSNAFGAVVEGFSQMDGSVALSQANGPSDWNFQAIIGGSGSNRFQDALYLDGFSGMFVSGTHFEAVLNDDINIGPVNPVYNVGIYNVTSSATMGNCAIELGTGSSGNQIHGVSRPSGGCLAKDDNLSTPTIGTSVSATPASWTIPEYVQSGNAGVSIVASGNVVVTGTVTATSYQFTGAPYISGPIPGSAMSPTTSGNSAIGVSSDGNWYVSNNAAAIDEVCTHGNGACTGGGSGTVSSSTIGYIPQYTGTTTVGTPSPLLDNGVTTANTLTYAGSAGIAAASYTGTGSNGGYSATEGTGASVSTGAGKDAFYPDSTNHCLHANYNNTDVGCVDAASNTETLTNKTISGASNTLSPLLNTIASATAANTPLTNGNFLQTWGWQLTSTTGGLLLTESTASTGTGPIFGVTTLSGSTATPATIIQGAITGTAATPALTVNTTLNNAGLTNTCVICSSVTNTTSNGSSRWLLFNGGTSGSVNELAVDMSGNIFSSGGTYTGLATSTTATLCGGASSGCTVTVNGASGGATVQGQDNSNTGTSVKAGPAIVRGGMLTGTANAAALEGMTQVGQGYESNGTVTQWLVQCGTLTQYEVTNCGTTPAVNVVGVATNTQSTAHAAVGVVAYGQVPITFDGATTLGDIACLSTTTAGEAHDNGTTACSTAGAQIGVIVANSGAITGMSNNSTASATLGSTLAVVQLHLMGSGSSGGGTTYAYLNTKSYGSSGVAFTPLANNITVWAIEVDHTVTINNIGFSISTLDATNKYDIGIYGPNCAGGSSCSLITHVGAASYAATGTQNAAATGAPITLTPGYYYIATTGNATTAQIGASNSNAFVINPLSTAQGTATTSSVGALPSTITLASAGATISTNPIPQVMFH